MKQRLIQLSLAAMFFFSFEMRPTAQVTLASWTSASSSSNPTIAPNNDGQGSNVSASVLSTGGGLTANAGSTYNWRAWDTANTSSAAANSAGDYFQWSITSINTLTFDELNIRYDRSGTGPDDVEIQYSIDNFTTAGNLIHTFDFNDNTSTQTFSIDISSIASLTFGQTLTFRLFAFNSESAGGTFDLENNGANTIEIAGFVSLPVELVDFSIKNLGNTNVLSWNTASETNNYYFHIEHSIDGFHFTSLEKVMGAGDSNEMQHYEFKHAQPHPGTNYYRLKQVDFDGTYSYSKTISVYFGKKTDTRLYPTLATESINLEFGRENENGRTLQIFDSMGTLIREEKSEGEETTKTLDIRELRPGSYFLKILKSNTAEAIPFVKN